MSFNAMSNRNKRREVAIMSSYKEITTDLLINVARMFAHKKGENDLTVVLKAAVSSKVQHDHRKYENCAGKTQLLFLSNQLTCFSYRKQFLKKQYYAIRIVNKQKKSLIIQQYLAIRQLLMKPRMKKTLKKN